MESRKDIQFKLQTEIFEKLWNLYDYKIGKKPAFKTFLKVKPSQYEQLFAHVKMFVTYTHIDGAYPSRPHLKTYLNQERYFDEHIKTPQSEEAAWKEKLRKKHAR